jgi:flagellar secretion chaperone FliS
VNANLTYRASSARASNGVGIVILLYEQLVQDLRRGVIAMDEGDVETRTLELGHALEVVGQLQGRLDMENGGNVAQNLDRFYTVLRAGILDAQFKTSKTLLEKLIENVLSMREAWVAVEQSTISGQVTAESSALPKTETHEAAAGAVARDWHV